MTSRAGPPVPAPTVPGPTVPAPAAPRGGTLEKGLAVVQFVAEQGEVTAGTVMEAFGLSRSATYRLLDRLRAGGYLQGAGSPGAYRLGPRMVVIGLRALDQVNLVQVAPPLLAALARAAGETVHLAVPDGDDMVFVHLQDGPGVIRVSERLGIRRPMNCSSLGKALLAFLPDGEREERLAGLTYTALTDRSLTTPDALGADLALVRRRGYAIDDGEVQAGVACLGAPLLDARGRPVGAISLSGPAERMAATRETVTPLLLETARDISRRLGHLA